MHNIKSVAIILFATLIFSGCGGSSPNIPNQTTLPVQPKDDVATLSKIKNKNELVSLLLKLSLSTYLESNSFGQMREFHIDTDAKSFVFSIDLKGEKAPLRVVVSKYEVQKEGGKVYFVAKNLTTDKEWLNLVAKKYLQEKKVEIPSKYSMFALLAL